jgi:hypothetical protein
MPVICWVSVKEHNCLTLVSSTCMPEIPPILCQEKDLRNVTDILLWIRSVLIQKNSSPTIHVAVMAHHTPNLWSLRGTSKVCLGLILLQCPLSWALYTQTGGTKLHRWKIWILVQKYCHILPAKTNDKNTIFHNCLLQLLECVLFFGLR